MSFFAMIVQPDPTDEHWKHNEITEFNIKFNKPMNYKGMNAFHAWLNEQLHSTGFDPEKIK